METRQENKLSMMEASIEVLDGHSAQVATVPALVAAKSALVAKTLGIRNANQTQQKTTKGKTKDKEARKFTLADTAYSTAAAVQAYAAVTDNNDLFELVNFSRWKLRKTDDEEIQQVCQLIHNQAASVIASLADYGIDAADLLELQDLIDEWSAKSQVPRVAISERKAATASIPTLFKQADSILTKQMDKLMENFLTSDPDFYATYHNARRIVNAGHGSGGGTIVLTGDIPPMSTVNISDNVAPKAKVSVKNLGTVPFTICSTDSAAESCTIGQVLNAGEEVEFTGGSSGTPLLKPFLNATNNDPSMVANYTVSIG